MATTQTRLDELNAEIVEKIAGRNVTRGELLEAFNRVANSDNWKLAVNAVVTVNSYFELELIRSAVVFFTGSPTHCTTIAHGVTGGTYQIIAAGYYAAVGA